MPMHTLDWLVIAVYLAGMLVLAFVLGRAQKSRRDYFLGGNHMGPLSLATSTMATQCSTNSLLGAPAFVGFTAAGGLLWLQYELAVPLAMLVLVWLLSAVRRGRQVSVYGFLQQQLGRRARLLASAVFLIFRGVATGVTVYGVGVLTTMLVDISYTQAVLLLMGVTIIYDLLGGMRAVVISDVVQMLLIVTAVAVSLILLSADSGGPGELLAAAGREPLAGRLQALDFSWGFSGDNNFAFWPMLIGGLFLYMAYYGCDQSQAQRVLASRSQADAERILLLNGLLRFPVVLLYCLLGIALAVYAVRHPGFIESLPLTALGQPNYNLVFPHFVVQAFPAGVVGLIMVGLFAAAMSSIDSALNSLAAATVEDHLPGAGTQSASGRLLLSKAITLGWGLFAVAFSYQVESIAPTVLEAINKIGSMANGPLLALFVLALLTPRVGEVRAISGFICGLAANLALWWWAPQVSWLWWNVWGCLVALAAAWCLGPVRWTRPGGGPAGATRRWLGGMFLLILTCCVLFGVRG